MALGDGTGWDETTPTDATSAINIDDYNRDLRKGIRARFAKEHEMPDSQSATSEGGAHKYMTLQMQTGAPAISGTQVGALYQKTVGTTGDYAFFLNAATQEINLSKKMYFWFVDGALDTGADISATLNLVSNGKIYDAKAYISTTGVGSAIQVDINYNGVSIWTATSAQLILAAGATSTSVATFVTTNVTAGGTLKLDIDKIGSTTPGGNLTVMVEVG